MSPILALMYKIAGAPQEEPEGIKESSFAAAELLCRTFDVASQMPEHMHSQAIKVAAQEIRKAGWQI